MKAYSSKNTDSVSATAAKSDITSPASDREKFVKNLGGLPPEKGVKEIAAENTPKKAPGSIRG